jgi:hypothetical protein
MTSFTTETSRLKPKGRACYGSRRLFGGAVCKCLSDQRINLGVLVWHPVDGYRCRISPSVDRVQAIDPLIAVRSLKKQLDDIKESIAKALPAEQGFLVHLAKTFRRGLVISSPYPAKISSVDETLSRLYDLLVSSIPEIRRASSQRLFENSLKKTIRASLEAWPEESVQELGTKTVKGIPINLGMRTQVSQTGRAALWHPFSLQSEAKSDTQLAGAKAIVLDIFKTREMGLYKRDMQYVAVQAPRARSASKFEDVISCLKHAADDVFVANDDVTLFNRVQQGLRALEHGARAHA